MENDTHPIPCLIDAFTECSRPGPGLQYVMNEEPDIGPVGDLEVIDEMSGERELNNVDMVERSNTDRAIIAERNLDPDSDTSHVAFAEDNEGDYTELRESGTRAAQLMDVMHNRLTGYARSISDPARSEQVLTMLDAVKQEYADSQRVPNIPGLEVEVAEDRIPAMRRMTDQMRAIANIPEMRATDPLGGLTGGPDFGFLDRAMNRYENATQMLIDIRNDIPEPINYQRRADSTPAQRANLPTLG